MRRIGWVLALGVLCLPAVWPLTQGPFFASDDGLFHLFRLAALDDALHQGNLYPRLFPSFAFGYGQAVLAYYGPLSYYFAELPRLLGASYADAIKWAFAAGYLGSALGAYALARRFVAPEAALLGAVVYTYFPYHLAETYQRGALAEHLAFVFLPLILWAITLPVASNPLGLERPLSRQGSKEMLILAASTAGLLLTHSLTALIFLPCAFVYFAAMHWRRIRRWRIVPAMVGLLAAAGITAFYWLPLLTESRWVGLSAGLDNAGYLTHLAPLAGLIQPSLVFQYPPKQGVSADHPLGLLSLLLLLATLALTAVAWRRRDRLILPVLLFGALALFALFMTLDISSGIWTALHNPLTFLQYPWRFMTLSALGIAMGAALTFGVYPRAVYIAVPVIIFCAMAALQPNPVSAAPADTAAMWLNDYRQRQIGATWTAEYVPWWVRADRTAIPAQAHSPVSAVGLAVPPLNFQSSGYDSWAFEIPAGTNTPCVPSEQTAILAGGETNLLRFHQFYLPQWHVSMNGIRLQTFPSGDLGLLSVLVPINQGGCPLTLAVQFAPTDIETFGGVIALITLLGIAWYWRGWWLVPVAIGFLGIALALALMRPLPPHPLLGSTADVQIANFARLLEAHTDQASYHAGDAVRVTITWYAQSETRENFKGFVHLTDVNSIRVVAQSDSEPVGGFTPTSQWRVGEVIEETRSLRIPDDAVSGVYQIYTGLYHADSVQNLPATLQGQAQRDGRILLGEVHVAAR
jgi:6-pyruvoyl-tetrahydropterin synthase-like protein